MRMDREVLALFRPPSISQDRPAVICTQQTVFVRAISPEENATEGELVHLMPLSLVFFPDVPNIARYLPQDVLRVTIITPCHPTMTILNNS